MRRWREGKSAVRGGSEMREKEREFGNSEDGQNLTIT